MILRMKRATAKRIAQIYREVEDEFEEHSTAFLLEITAERVRKARVIPNCDCGHVTDALVKEKVYK